MTWCARCGLVAGPLFALVVVVFAARWPGYEHGRMPPALLGAWPRADAPWFDLLGYGLCGLLALLAMHALYVALRRAHAGLVARLGATVAQLSALAYIALGVFPLELGQALDEGMGRRHVAAWILWWLAACAGGPLLAAGAMRLRGWRSIALTGLLSAALIAWALLFAPVAIGVSQRIALAAWFGWIACASWQVLRGSRRL